MEEVPNIFCRKVKKYSKEEILKAIPKEAVENQNIELGLLLVEWRWRFLKKINTKNIVEISYKNPNENRLYLNSKK